MARTKNNLSNEDFLKSYLNTQASGGTFEDLAAETNLVGQSLYQRFNKLQKIMAIEGIELPKMPLKPKKTANMNALVAIVKLHLGPIHNNASETVTVTTTTVTKAVEPEGAKANGHGNGHGSVYGPTKAQAVQMVHGTPEQVQTYVDA